MSVRQGRCLELETPLRDGRGAAGVRRAFAAASLLLVFGLSGAPVARAQDPNTPAHDPAAPAQDSLAPATTSVAPSAVTAQPASPPAATPASPRPVVTAAVSTAPAAVTRHEPESIPPLADLSGWLEYRTRHHIASLPVEARLFYRRGVLSRESGNAVEGSRLVRGAAELDPSYIAPHLTLASWTLLREPSQALLHYGTVLEMARQNFRLQLALAANAIYAVLQALFFGFLGTGLLIVVVRQAELRHPWREQMSRWLSATSASAWSWAFLVLPFCLGFGPALPTVLMLGLLWTVLRGRERFVFVMLVASLAALPWITGALDRLTLPLDEARGPLYGVAMVETEPASPARAADLRALATTHPDNAFMQFASGWMSRRTGDLPAAEGAYRRALELWPDDDRVMVDLGNVLLLQGHTDDALALYKKASDANAANAGAWFNQSQIHTQRYDYRAATDALSRASALNFDMVKTYQAQGSEDGVPGLVDQWIAPARFWRALTSQGALSTGHGALPPQWRSRLETRGWTFTFVLLGLSAVAMWAGARQHRALPLRTCSNCGRVVCRRCSERRRELALCPRCVAAENRAESPDFARVLLLQQRRRTERFQHLIRTALATLVPGLGLVSFRRAFSPLLLMTATAALLTGPLGGAPPFSFEPRLAVSGTDLPMPLQLAAWGLIYLWSVVGYFRLVAKAGQQAATLAAPVRSRATQASAHSSTSAAA